MKEEKKEKKKRTQKEEKEEKEEEKRKASNEGRQRTRISSLPMRQCAWMSELAASFCSKHHIVCSRVVDDLRVLFRLEESRTRKERAQSSYIKTMKWRRRDGCCKEGMRMSEW